METWNGLGIISLIPNSDFAAIKMLTSNGKKSTMWEWFNFHVNIKDMKEGQEIKISFDNNGYNFELII